jgi:hypothetical protein
VIDFPTGVRNSGASPHEMIGWFPCDDLRFPSDDVYFRAVDVDAPAAFVFRRLSQLRTGRIPRNLGAGLEPLKAGQRFARFCRIVSCVAGEHITVAMRSSAPHWLLGDFVATYRLDDSPAGVRVVVKKLVRYPAPPYGWLVRRVMPLLDRIALGNRLGVLAARSESDYERAQAMPH